MQDPHLNLSFVTCVSDTEVLRQRLLASPCLQAGGYPLLALHNARSAADAFNTAISAAPADSWLVWVHQDVFLPAGWEHSFAASLQQAQALFPQLAVAGVYGLSGHADQARRAGHVLDRGTLLREPAALPCRADSLDELLFAVRADSGLTLDPALGFDFYATDLVLQAQAHGLACAVVDAYCEHWSGTAQLPQHVAAATRARIAASGEVFERKWAHKLPLTTPCFDIRASGDVARFLAQVYG